MDSIYKDLEFNENFSIIGDNENQILQIVLKKGDSIITKNSNIPYESSDIESVPYTLTKDKENNTSKKYITESSLIKVQNVKTSFSYVGLSIGHGKIMKILPLLYNGLFVRYEDILAFSSSIYLVNNSEVNREMISFAKPSTLNFPDYRNYIFYQIDSPLDVNNSFNFQLTDYKNLKSYLFLQNKSNITFNRHST